MREHPDHEDRYGPLALAILGASRVVDLSDHADLVAALVREIRRPLPDLSSLDLEARERELVLALLAKDEAANRFLSLVVSGM